MSFRVSGDESSESLSIEVEVWSRSSPAMYEVSRPEDPEN